MEKKKKRTYWGFTENSKTSPSWRMRSVFVYTFKFVVKFTKSICRVLLSSRFWYGMVRSVSWIIDDWREIYLPLFTSVRTERKTQKWDVESCGFGHGMKPIWVDRDGTVRYSLYKESQTISTSNLKHMISSFLLLKSKY